MIVQRNILLGVIFFVLIALIFGSILLVRHKKNEEIRESILYQERQGKEKRVQAIVRDVSVQGNMEYSSEVVRNDQGELVLRVMFVEGAHWEEMSQEEKEELIAGMINVARLQVDGEKAQVEVYKINAVVATGHWVKDKGNVINIVE